MRINITPATSGNNPQSRNISSAQNHSVNNPQRRKLNVPVNENRSAHTRLNISKSSNVTISEEARNRLIQNRELFGNESVAVARQRQLEELSNSFEFVDNDTKSHPRDVIQEWKAMREQHANPWSGRFIGFSGSIINDTLKNHGVFENNQAQSDLIAHFEDEFRRIVNSPVGDGPFDSIGWARFGLSMLANVYAEIRQTIEERFTGPELEDHLRWLSQGFDILATDVARGVVRIAELDVKGSQATSEMSDAELRRLERKMERFTADIESLVQELAQAFRRFALENGVGSRDKGIELFDAFLQSQEFSDNSLLTNMN